MRGCSCVMLFSSPSHWKQSKERVEKERKNFCSSSLSLSQSTVWINTPLRRALDGIFHERAECDSPLARAKCIFASFFRFEEITCFSVSKQSFDIEFLKRDSGGGKHVSRMPTSFFIIFALGIQFQGIFALSLLFTLSNVKRRSLKWNDKLRPVICNFPTTPRNCVFILLNEKEKPSLSPRIIKVKVQLKECE